MALYEEYGLKDRVAIITGSGTGMGAATAVLLAQCGAKVALFGRRAEKLENTKNKCLEYTPDVLTFSVDVRDKDSVEKAVAAVAEKYGRIDILFNNAGIETQYQPGESLWDDYFNTLGDDDYMAFFATHCLGHYHMNNAVIPYMQKQHYGRILNNTSVTGYTGQYSSPGYVASKAAAILQTRTYAIKYAYDGIMVNALAPGFVNTPLKEVTPNELAEFAARMPSGHATSPEEIARMAIFFMQENLITTGQTLKIDPRGTN